MSVEFSERVPVCRSFTVPTLDLGAGGPESTRTSLWGGPVDTLGPTCHRHARVRVRGCPPGPDSRVDLRAERLQLRGPFEERVFPQPHHARELVREVADVNRRQLAPRQGGDEEEGEPPRWRGARPCEWTPPTPPPYQSSCRSPMSVSSRGLRRQTRLTKSRRRSLRREIK